MKILMLTDSMGCGGAQTHICSLSKELRREGHTVTVVSCGGENVNTLLKSGVKHFKMPFKKSPFYLLCEYATLKALIEKGDFDIIHSHARLPATLVNYGVNKKNCTVVSTVHAFFDVSLGRRALSKWGESSIAVSEDLKKYLVKNYGCPPSQIEVIPNGIDLSAFRKMPSKQNNEKDKITVAFLSRLDADCSTGAMLLCKIATAIVEKYGKRVRFLIGGGGNAFLTVKNIAHKVNQKLGYNCIELFGRVENVPEFLRRADIFVGVSRTVIEAAACGKPCIVCGNEGFSGVLTENNFKKAAYSNFCARGQEKPTAKKLYEAVKMLIEKIDENSKDEESQSIRRKIFSEYDIKRTAKKTVDFYNKCKNAKKKDVFLCGYYGYGNVGDDVLLNSAISRAKSEFEGVNVVSITKNGTDDERRFDCKCISRKNIFEIIKSVEKCNYFILGGGNLIDEFPSIRSMLYYSISLIFAKMCGAKCLIWGGGFGKFSSAFSKLVAKRALMSCSYIGCRDTASLFRAKKLLGNYKKSDKTVFLERDLAEAFYIQNKEKFFAHCDEKYAKMLPPYVVAAPKGGSEYREYKKMLYDLLYARKSGCKVIFSVMQPSCDRRICEIFCGILGGEIVSSNFIELTDMLKKSEGVYSMRLHALIAARIAGVPMHAYGKSEKIKSFMGDQRRNL